MPSLLQAATALTDSHAIEAVAVGAIVGLGKVWDHVKGQRRDRAKDERMDTINTTMQYMERKMDDVSDDVRDLRAFIVGPDGENGIRGDVRELKADIKGILERERTNLRASQVGSFLPPR